MPAMGLSGPKYFGGKAGPTGAWIASTLPAAYNYIEPYGGMCGVLLQRPPSPCEIVNDLDNRIVTWWRVLRDRPQDLLRWLELTPYSRTGYGHTQAVVGDTATFNSAAATDEVAAAGHVAVALQQGFRCVPHGQGGWRPTTFHTRTAQPSAWVSLLGRMYALADRLRGVELESCDAVWLASRWVGQPDCLVYLDPPYAQGGHNYSHGPDHTPLLDLLQSGVKAKVAISGYATCPWAVLESEGWHRQERAADNGMSRGKRVEVLWSNFPPLGQPRLPTLT